MSTQEISTIEIKISMQSENEQNPKAVNAKNKTVKVLHLC